MLQLYGTKVKYKCIYRNSNRCIKGSINGAINRYIIAKTKINQLIINALAMHLLCIS